MDALDAARYRWLNKQHNLLIYIEGPEEKPVRQQLRLRCGLPLNDWIDARMKEEEEASRGGATRQDG